MGNILPFERPDEIPCPGCGHDMPRDLIRCRYCRASLLPAPSRRPLPGWTALGLLLVLVAVVVWMLLSA